MGGNSPFVKQIQYCIAFINDAKIFKAAGIQGSEQREMVGSDGCSRQGEAGDDDAGGRDST